MSAAPWLWPALSQRVALFLLRARERDRQARRHRGPACRSSAPARHGHAAQSIDGRTEIGAVGAREPPRTRRREVVVAAAVRDELRFELADGRKTVADRISRRRGAGQYVAV